MQDFLVSIRLDHVALLTIGVLACRWLYFHSKVWNISRLGVAYERNIDTVTRNPSDSQPFRELSEMQPQVSRLFKQAGLRSPQMSFTQATGLGQGITGMVPTWENLHSSEPQAVYSNIQSFHRAKGYFRGQRNETLSLVFWFESLINWPATVLGMIGLDKSGSLAKLLKLVALVLEIGAAIHLFLAQGQ